MPFEKQVDAVSVNETSKRARDYTRDKQLSHSHCRKQFGMIN